ncbi:MAG: carboxymuconolactone decarboxylase family protein [Corynebacterium sp.]|uniref:carboxymuconolactone decarboxylase family protein n=1 Tax=Corynebacterium sp. TaxID=1720 RepID=UPI0026DB04C9|nr:carboxymuconolactone decarboxylase family protein [Corynebacterium sp.]MDO4760714.1 carboxymuconolactone decarboxylase family protein [Corynebacterium sp.]
MSVENLKSALPDYAKDLKLNLGTLARQTVLNDQQKWGTFLACAAATKNPTVIREINEEVAAVLSPEAQSAAFAAASIMGMNNIAYRAKGWLGEEFANIRMGLRMNIMANPGVEKADFELWATAVSAINGCEHCTIAHEKVLTAEGVSKEQIFEVVKIAATVSGVAQALSIQEALA